MVTAEPSCSTAVRGDGRRERCGEAMAIREVREGVFAH
jgi:hypothetical protein